VTNACNPSYSGGRDQEDHGSKPTWENSSARTYLDKNPSQKRAGGVAQGVNPVPQKKKKKKASRILEISNIISMTLIPIQN
jgi:hypothetical protein